ncbi:calpain [Fusarium coicis]|nr:calpain [Fusarium coicis]
MSRITPSSEACDVTKKQTKKNERKRKRRRAEWGAEQNHLDGEFNSRVKAEAEKAAEDEKRAQEADEEVLSKSTKEIKISEDKDGPVVVDEHHKGLEQESLFVRPRPAYDSASESPHSPVEDWEALYSSDGMAHDYDSKEERMPRPWNAICIVDVRVYSKDENLDLRTVMEGSEPLGEGVGSKRATDHGDAQFNPGDGRSDDGCFRDKTGRQEISLDISKESKYAEEYTI